jgi:hypothetical protein
MAFALFWRLGSKILTNISFVEIMHPSYQKGPNRQGVVGEMFEFKVSQGFSRETSKVTKTNMPASFPRIIPVSTAK